MPTSRCLADSGHLEELFEAVTWNQLGIHDKPVGLLNVGGYFDKLLKFLRHAREEGFVATREHVDGHHRGGPAGAADRRLGTLPTGTSAQVVVRPMESQAAVPHVEYRNVQKSYDGRTVVVEDLDLTVEKGEFLTLLGPSGSGKTTCLMMLAGFEQPSAGAILVDGQSVHDLPPDKRGIGVVFQNYALFPHMTVGGNLAFPLEVRRLPPNERAERVQGALRPRATGGFRGPPARDSSPAASSNGWRSPVRWCSSRNWC